MKNYAMVLKNEVIAVLLNQETIPFYPPDIEGNPVTAIEFEDGVTLGMSYRNGEFVEYDPNYKEPVEYTDVQLIMQAFADSELRDFEAQLERMMLGQQLTEIELAQLEMEVEDNV